MAEFFKTYFFEDTRILFIAGVFLFFLILFFVFALIQSRANRRFLREMKEGYGETQKKAFLAASELLSAHLTEYADTTLLDRVNRCYEQLVDRELLPCVNDAARKMAELAEAMADHQKNGLLLIAEDLAGLFARRLDQYVTDQADTVSALQEITVSFSQELSRITATLNTLSTLHNNAFTQTSAAFEAVSKTSEQMGGKVLELGQMLESSSKSIADMQSLMGEHTALVSQLSEAVHRTRQDAEASAGLIEAQSQKTAELLNHAVYTMQQNSEHAAQSLLEQLVFNFEDSSQALSQSVSRLFDIAAAIEKSAFNFSEGLSSVYKDFGEGLNENLSQVSRSIVNVVNTEYQKIATGADGFSAMFQEGLSTMHKELDQHIQQLMIITEDLSRNVALFEGDVNTSASRFELGMEKSIGSALEQIDASLAEIVGRLVSVTVNIQQAADALPSALSALKKEE